MPKKPIISPEVKESVKKQVEEFNRVNFEEQASVLSQFYDNEVTLGYRARFKGKYLYLDRADGNEYSPICRLTWNGSMDNWDFAIYKYSNEFYDPGECLFPGSEKVDGTVLGAMEAGMRAYPY